MARGSAARQLIRKIEAVPYVEDTKTVQMFSALQHLKEIGHLRKEEGVQILKWKSPRPLRYYLSNSEEDFIEASRVAFYPGTTERIRIHSLTSLNGVNYPAASAILMFYDRTKYPVLDIRVWQQLYFAKLVTTNPRGRAFTLGEWVAYMEAFSFLSVKTGFNVREIEKRIFDIDRMERLENLYS